MLKKIKSQTHNKELPTAALLSDAVQGNKKKTFFSHLSDEQVVCVKRNIALGESVYKDFSKILKNLSVTGPANPALKKYFSINLDAMYVGGQADIKIHKDAIAIFCKNYCDKTNMEILSKLIMDTKSIVTDLEDYVPPTKLSEIKYHINKKAILNLFNIWYLENREDIVWELY